MSIWKDGDKVLKGVLSVKEERRILDLSYGLITPKDNGKEFQKDIVVLVRDKQTGKIKEMDSSAMLPVLWKKNHRK